MWVPEHPSDDLLLALTRLGRALKTAGASERIDPAVVPVLHAVGCGQASRVSELADVLNLDASTVSRHVRALVDGGHLARTDDPADRRASRLALTTEGSAFLDGALRRKAARLADATAGWPPTDVVALVQLVDRLTTSLDPTSAPLVLSETR